MGWSWGCTQTRGLTLETKAQRATKGQLYQEKFNVLGTRAWRINKEGKENKILTNQRKIKRRIQHGKLLAPETGVSGENPQLSVERKPRGGGGGGNKISNHIH